jgi:hypothetical protein
VNQPPCLPDADHQFADSRAAPITGLTKKIHRQPRVSRSSPPRTAPASGESIITAPAALMALAAFAFPAARITMICPVIIRPPAAPWRTRNAISSATDDDRP